MQETGSGQRSHGQTDHPHQTFLVAIGFDEGHNDGSPEGTEADDGDEESAVSDARRQRHLAMVVSVRRSARSADEKMKEG